jgi:hypothetical protein
MVIHIGETEVFEWQMPQPFVGLRDRKAVSSYVVEESANVPVVHGIRL